jgi:hypothetical protein
MTLKTVPVTGVLYLADGTTPAASTLVTATLTTPDQDQTDPNVVVPSQVTATTDASGNFTLRLWPNTRGVNGSQYWVRSNIPGALPANWLLNVLITVPDGDANTNVPINTITNRTGPSVLSDSRAAMLAAQGFALQAMGAQAAVAYLYPDTFATAPTKRPDGTAIQAGDRYANSTDGYEYVYVNGAWTSPGKNAAISAASALTSQQQAAAEVAYVYPGVFNPASPPATRPDGTARQSGDYAFFSDNIGRRFNGSTWVASDINTANLASSTGASLIGIDTTTVAGFFKTSSNKVIDSIAALKAVDHTKYTRAFVLGYYADGDGGGGAYWYDPADTTSADNSGTIIVATDGARWKLQRSSWVSVKQFGAKGDGVTDDTSAFLNAIGAVSHLWVPGSKYIISQCLNIKKCITIEGESGTNDAVYPSYLEFPNNTVGLFLHSTDTNADSTGHNPAVVASTTGAGGSIIRNLWILHNGGAGVAVNDAISHGIWVKCKALIEDCTIAGFAGNGIHVVAGALNADPFFHGNANNFHIARCRLSHNYHGLYVDGEDANAGEILHISCGNNNGWGIWDSSFLGNHYTQPHTENNALGSYYTDNVNAHSHFSNPYSESGHVAEQFGPNTTVTNGTREAIISADSSDLIPRGMTGSDRNCTKVGRVSITAGGTGYTTATVTISAPTQTQATAAAVISGGRITKATLTNQGGGYSSTPNITVTGDGTSARAVAHIDKFGKIESISMADTGTGYTTATITIDPPAAGATATAVATLNGGSVSSIILTSLGNGYSADPTVTITGDGTGATATATRVGVQTGLTFANEFNLTYGDTMWSWSTTGSSAFRMSMNRATLDHTWCFGGTVLGMQITGPSTLEKFGRSSTVPYAKVCQQGVWLGDVITNNGTSNARNVTFRNTVPPTSGQWARGDIIFAVSPSAGGSPGVVCTTGGTAGSTAVFKAMANVAA